MPKFTQSPSSKEALSGHKTEGSADDEQFHPIYRINRLPDEAKRKIYATLIPPQIFTKFQIDPETLCNQAGESVFTCHYRPRTSSMWIELRHQAGFADPLFLLEMRDTPFGDIEILFLNMNNPDAERFQIDRDAFGNNTVFATVARNLPEEMRALRAGSGAWTNPERPAAVSELSRPGSEILQHLRDSTRESGTPGLPQRNHA